MWNWTDAGASNYRVISSTGGNLSPLLGGDVLSFSEGGLAANTAYTRKLTAYNCISSTTTDATSRSTLAQTVTFPAQPVLESFSGFIKASWNALPASPQTATAEGYVLEASSTNFGALAPGGVVYSSATGSIGVNVLKVSGLDSLTTYYLRVGSLNWDGVANYALMGSTVTPNFIQPGLANPVYTAITETAVSAQWTANGNPAGTLYSYEASMEPSFFTIFSSATYNTYGTIDGLSPNTLYYLHVNVSVEGSSGPYTALGSAMTLSVRPSGAFVSGITANAVTASWTELPVSPSSASASGFVVEASTTGFGALSPGGVTLSGAVAAPSAASASVGDLLANTTYYIRAGSINSAGATNYVLLGAVQTSRNGPPGDPHVNGVSAGGVSAEWTDINADAYELRASSAGFAAGTAVASTFTAVAHSTQLLLSNLLPNTSYTFQVGAVFDGATYYALAGSAITFANTPAGAWGVPLSTSAISAGWEPNSNPAGTRYALSYSTAPDFSGQLHAMPVTDSTHTIISPLVYNTTYYFRVLAYNQLDLPSTGYAFASAYTLDMPPPAPPVISSVITGKGGAVGVSWQAPPEAIEHYRIFRATWAFTAPSGAQLLNGNISTLSHMDTPPADGGYYYALTAVSIYGKESALSAPAGGISDRTPPAAPDGLGAIASIFGKEVYLDWTASSGAASYNIYRATYEASGIELLAPLISGTTVLSLTDRPADDAVYRYFVTALDVPGNESVSFSSAAVTYDIHPPLITVAGIAANAHYNHDVHPSFAVSDFSSYSATAALNGVPWVAGSTVSAPGAYAFAVSAADYFGSTSSVSVAFTVDKSSPAISITYPPDGAIINGNVTVVYSSTDDFTAADRLVVRDSQGRLPPFVYSAEGVHIASFTCTDLAGNSATAQAVFTIDKTSPTAVSDLAIAQITPGGMVLQWTAPSDAVSGTAGYILATATYALTAANFSSAQVIAGLPAPLQAGATETFTVQFSTAQTRFFALETRDAAGNVSAVSNLAFIDMDGPVFSALTPSASVRISRPTVVSVQAADISGVSGVDFILDGVLVSSSSAAPYSFFWNTLAYADGEHRLVIRSTDTIGNAGQMQALYDLRYAPPATPVVTYPSNNFGTTSPYIVVTGAAEPGITVEARIDGFAAGTAVAAADGSFQLPVTLPDEGTHSLAVAAGDSAGTSAPSSALTVYYNISAPPNPAALTAASLPGGHVGLSWSAGDGKAASYYNVYRSTFAAAFSPSAVPSLAYLVAGRVAAAAYNDLPPSDGVYYYGVTAADLSGNESGSGDPAAALSDRVVPSAAVAVGAVPPLGPGSYAVTLTLSKALASAPILLFAPAGQGVAPVDLSASSPTVWTGTVTVTGAMPSGVAGFSFQGTDLVGNTGHAITSGSALEIDTQGPGAGIAISPVSPVRAGTVTVNVTLTETAVSTPSLFCVLPSSASLPVILAGGGRNWQGQISVPSGENGTAYFVYSATDTLGNIASAVSSGATFIVDTTPPGAPLFARAVSQKNGAVQLSWSAPLGEAPLHYSVYRGSIPVAVELQPKPDGSGAYSETLPDGDYVYYASAVDAAGNEGQQSQPAHAMAKASLPGAPEDISIGFNEYGRIELGWQEAYDPAVTGFMIYRATWVFASSAGIAAVAASTPPYIDTPQSNGQYYYRVSAVDFAGNESPLSVSTDTYWGKAPPVVTIGGVSDGGLYNHAVNPVYSASDPALDTATVSGLLNGQPFASGAGVSADGNYTLSAYAANLSGVGSTQTVHFTLDMTPPQLSVDGIAEGMTYNAAVLPLVTASDIRLASVSLNLDGSPCASGVPITANGGHTLIVTAGDLAGNTSTSTIHFTLNLPPAAPQNVVFVSQEGAGALISWTAPAAGMAGYRVYKDGALASQGLVTAAQFSDPAYAMGAAAVYEVSAVDSGGQEGARARLQLPAVSFGMDSFGSNINGAQTLSRGYFDT
ncbi:MAG: Ig-like domain-containing protein, partial [Elusimicrobiales bacterium]